MSLKRDKFSSKDKYFMNIAINIAKSNTGYTAENPSVGCVVVKNNQILSFGTTSYFGRPHAEVNALKSCKNTKGSTVYIEGQGETRQWQDTNGNDRYSTEVVLRPYKGQLVLVDSRSEVSNQNNIQTINEDFNTKSTDEISDRPQIIEDDEIPF